MNEILLLKGIEQAEEGQNDELTESQISALVHVIFGSTIELGVHVGVHRRRELPESSILVEPKRLQSDGKLFRRILLLEIINSQSPLVRLGLM